MTAQRVSGTTWHRRLGPIGNAFRYRVDYVLLDPERDVDLPWLFSRNRWNLMALFDRDHGGPRGDGRGAAWMRDVLAEFDAPGSADWRLLLLAQPRILGTRFSPVSFWFALDPEGRLRAAVAEVNNTFGDRHSYLCARPGFLPIATTDVLEARKVFHVSPFQPVEGQYRFTFGLTPDAVSVRIDYRHGAGGLLAGLAGPLSPLKSGAVLGIVARRPLGALRVLGLIHWQAAKLWLRGAPFRPRPAPPEAEVSR